MNRNRLCELYDSQNPAEGQAFDVQLTSEISGWKELNFSIPQMVNGRQNFRWDYLRSGYMVRLARDGAADWYLLEAPRRSHKGLEITATVTCGHIASILNKKQLYLAFDDTNGIGSAQYLLKQVLAGTGWQLGFCENFLEDDGETEKIRSLTSEEKRGAYL